jgi:hypothetical protein
LQDLHRDRYGHLQPQNARLLTLLGDSSIITETTDE